MSAGPSSVTPIAALLGLRREPQVWFLSGPWSLLTWDVEPAGIDDIGPLRDAAVAGDPEGRGWTAFTGTHLMQADYEGTVDVVRVRSGLRWSPGGGVHPFGGAPPPAPGMSVVPRLAGPLLPAWDGADHRRRVDALRGRIAAGEFYQVNLTVPFTGRLAAGDDLDVAAALLARSPAPFAAVIRRPGRPTVISHSPECFVAATGRTLLSCPIKGTRRADDPADLLAAPKDRAELAMIVDLVRNDLGRIAEAGTVRVADPARVLHLPYVRHLVADVIARARPGTGWRTVLAAAFPPGSITGAPKDMAMRRIAADEAGPRGAYCGAFGWAGATGGQLAVAIRTLTVAPAGTDAAVVLHAGSGIVADSDGDAEWDEVRAKASAMAAALGGTL